MRADAVTAERAAEVFLRDGGCLAPRLGGSAHDCWGRNRIEHVKRESRMGKRGDLLGTLCEGHTEPGMKAGYVWCTDRRNREAMRRHLLELEEDPHSRHVDPCPSCPPRHYLGDGWTHIGDADYPYSEVLPEGEK